MPTARRWHTANRIRTVPLAAAMRGRIDSWRKYELGGPRETGRPQRRIGALRDTCSGVEEMRKAGAKRVEIDRYRIEVEWFEHAAISGEKKCES